MVCGAWFSGCLTILAGGAVLSVVSSGYRPLFEVPARRGLYCNSHRPKRVRFENNLSFGIVNVINEIRRYSRPLANTA